MSPPIKLPDGTAALHTTPALQANIPKPKFYSSTIPPAPPRPPTQSFRTKKSPQTNLPEPIHKPKATSHKPQATSQKRKKQKQVAASPEVSNPHRRTHHGIIPTPRALRQPRKSEFSLPDAAGSAEPVQKKKEKPQQQRIREAKEPPLNRFPTPCPSPRTATYRTLEFPAPSAAPRRSGTGSDPGDPCARGRKYG